MDAEAVGDAEVVAKGENSVADLGAGGRAAIWLAAAAGTQGPRFLKFIDDCHRRVAKHAPFWFVDFIEQRARFEGVVVQGPVEEPDAIFLQVVAQLPLPDLG